MSGEKPIVTRTLALLGAFFFAPTLFAFWGFRLAGTVCHHTDAIEHKSQVGSRIGSGGRAMIHPRHWSRQSSAIRRCASERSE